MADGTTTSHWTFGNPTPWYSTTQPTFADGPTRWHLTDSGARFHFPLTDISATTNGGPNTTLGLALKPFHYYTDRRHHSNTITAQRVGDSTMCPLNYYVCKPVKEESTEFDTTQWIQPHPWPLLECRSGSAKRRRI